MARFAVGQPITTTTPQIVVDAGLAIGTHRFQLEVIDSSGLRSKADIRLVTVQKPSVVVGPVVVGPVRPIRDPSGPVIAPVVKPAVKPIVKPVAKKPAVPRTKKPR
jgi:hypothetical protein